MRVPKGWMVLGAGYAGGRLVRALSADGAWAIGTTRRVSDAIALERSGAPALVHAFDGADLRLASPAEVAVLSIPPPRGDSEPAEPRALRWAIKQGARRVIYWSSTSVYGSSGGAVVDESTPVAPDTDVGRRRLLAEERVREVCASLEVELAIVRIVGLYGPGRNLRQRLERGDYALVDGGNGWSNRIHVDDIISATRHIAAQEGFAGVWLLSDGRPFQVKDFVAWNVEALGLPMPPVVPLESLAPRAQAFWTGNRRVSPERLFASGWSPTWPDWKVALRACWVEEGARLPDEQTPVVKK